jgi:putative acetyltransferase
VLTIRPELPDDHDAITAVVAAAFRSPAEARLVELIRASAGYRAPLALVADLDGEVVGHVMVSDADLHTPGGVRHLTMLSPLAVAPARHGVGIGGELVRTVCRRAGEAGEALVVLEGSPVYYGRFGFEPSALYGIELPIPDWATPAASQVLWLTDVDPTMTGRVVYSSAFDEFSG